MRAKPADASVTLLRRRMAGRYSFSVRDIARIMKVSIRTAERYLAKLKELKVVEYKYVDSDRYYHYRIRRSK